MTAPSDKNLSETLFNKIQPFKVKETSTISFSKPIEECVPQEQVLIDGLCTPSWFRILRRAFWIWQGTDAIEMESIFARVASSDNERTDPRLLDTVKGFVPGNWNFEWCQLAAEYVRKAKEAEEYDQKRTARKAWFRAAKYYSIASYPHLRGDELADQAQVQANIAYREGGKYLAVPKRTKNSFSWQRN